MNKTWMLLISTLLLFVYWLMTSNRLLPVKLTGDGFFGGYTFLYNYFIFSLILVGVFTGFYKGNKFLGLFINIFVVFIALVINFVIISTYTSYKIKKDVEKSYIDSPQNREINDPLRPISIMNKNYIEDFDGELVLEVQSIENFFDDKIKVNIEIKKDEYTYVSYKIATLYYINEEVKGRRVYRGEVYIEDGINIIWVEVENGNYIERKRIILKK